MHKLSPRLPNRPTLRPDHKSQKGPKGRRGNVDDSRQYYYLHFRQSIAPGDSWDRDTGESALHNVLDVYDIKLFTENDFPSYPDPATPQEGSQEKVELSQEEKKKIEEEKKEEWHKSLLFKHVKTKFEDDDGTKSAIYNRKSLVFTDLPRL